jgi:hypothetical protein
MLCQTCLGKGWIEQRGAGKECPECHAGQSYCCDGADCFPSTFDPDPNQIELPFDNAQVTAPTRTLVSTAT